MANTAKRRSGVKAPAAAAGLLGGLLLGAAVFVGGMAPARADGHAADTAPRFEPARVFDLEWASDPRIAPDGDSIVYVRNRMDIMTDRRQGQLWQVGADGERHRPLLSPETNASSPRWSPDGERLAYVSAPEGGSPQIFVRWMDTGQTVKVASLTVRPGNLAWSPDGTMIAYTARITAPQKPFAAMPRPPKGAQWAPAPTVVDTVLYKADGAGLVPEGHTQLFVVPAEGGTTRQVTSGAYNVSGAPVWLPDGTGLIFSSNRLDNWALDPVESDLYEVSLADGALKRLTDRDGPDASPSLSPDGRFLAFTGFDDQRKGFHTNRIHVMDRRSGAIRTLARDLDRSVRAVRWSPDNGGVYFLYDSEGVTRLARSDSAAGWTDLASGIGGTSIGRPYASGSFTAAPGGRFATVLTDARRPADVALVIDEGETTVTALTDLNGDVLPGLALSDYEAVTFPSSHDGRTIQGWYLTPPDFDPSKTYPLVLEIHGGPFANYGPRFSAEGQLFAAAGNVVLFVNPRGSTSYGNAFANLIHHNYPSQDYDDLISGVDALIEKGFIDQERLFVTGGSGGGTLTAWIVGKTDRFKAAVVAKPVINWQSFSLTADFYPFFTQYWFPAMPWEDPEGYWARSPLSLVGNVSTPTMLLTGEADYRTPMSETEQFYQALALRQVDTALVRIPGASHLIARRPSQLIAKVVHIQAWFDRYDPAKAAMNDAANGSMEANSGAEKSSDL